MTTEDKLDQEAKAVWEWNEQQLSKLGFSGLVLESMMKNRVDYHVVEKMLKRGATKNEVVRILL